MLINAIECATRRIGKSRAGRLLDGRDPACEMVSAGQAEDWPKYSGGYYGGCE